MKLSLIPTFFAAILLNPLKVSNADIDSATCINQADFSKGTYIIDTSGEYKLCEDIVFHPNGPAHLEVPTDYAFDPNFDADGYDEFNFGLGFFAAIAIAADDVKLYLNDHSLQQSPGHALFQRFYANIELANSPFIAGTGPAQFVGAGGFESANNVEILGPGTIGLSSHHGIHGNENSNVVIKDVTFHDFEVAAVSVNNVDGLEISNCQVAGNRQDVPVKGLFSGARFLRGYAEVLRDASYEMSLRGETVTAAEAYEALIDSINNVYNDVVYGSGYIDANLHPSEYALYDNPFKVVDGPCYAFLVHGKGPAVGGHGDVMADDHAVTSSDVLIKDNVIENIKCWVNEIPAVVEGGAVVNDARGAVFQWVNTVDGSPIAINEDGTYKGNVVADMQMMVANAILDGTITNSPKLQTMINTIPQSLIDWAKSGTDTYSPQYRCNGDSMHHVSKGIVIVRVEDTHGFDISNNVIAWVENLSVQPFSNCYDYHAGASEENAYEQQGPNIRGISIAADRGFDDGSNSIVKGNLIEHFATGDSCPAEVEADCEGCNFLTSGPCIDTVNNCWGVNSDGVCLAGTKCSGSTPSNYCEGCNALTSGPCIDSVGNCWGLNADGSCQAGVQCKGYKIVGIDVQGDTESCTIESNKVNLCSSIGEDPDDNYIGIRCRKHVNVDSVDIGENDVSQEVTLDNVVTTRLRRKMKALEGHPGGINEWQTGGCPFARVQPRIDL